MKINTAKFVIATIAIAIISLFSATESKAQGSAETPIGVNGYLTSVRISGSCTATAYKITYVQPGSPAANAGVNVGDVIFKANGVRVSSHERLRLMRLMLGNGRVSLHCFRGGVYTQTAYYNLSRYTPTGSN